MKQYTIAFQEKGVVLVNTDDQGDKVAVKTPTLEDELELPIHYEVSSMQDDSELGIISSHLPEKDRVQLKNGEFLSILTFEDEDHLTLRVNGRKYDIDRADADELPEEEGLEKLQEMGITHRYNIRSKEEQGVLDLFESDGRKRATLTTTSSECKAFLPLVMLERIMADVEGKSVKKKEVKAPTVITPRKSMEETDFTCFVKQHFAPRMIKDAFPYQDQKGEKDRFFTYMDEYTRPIILNGPTGNGKSVLTREYACERSIPYFYEKGGSSFRVSRTIGQFVPGIDKPVFSPGALTLALIHDGVYALEEAAPIHQDEFTALNVFLETGELPVNTHFGYELLRAGPNFRFVALGNFHANYTHNEWNDATLQRFNQLKMGYPSKDNTTDILMARAPGIEYDTAEMISSVLDEMRGKVHTYNKDLGLKGAVEVAQRIASGTNITQRDLFRDMVINPLVTYENDIAHGGGQMAKELMEVVEKFV